MALVRAMILLMSTVAPLLLLYLFVSVAAIALLPLPQRLLARVTLDALLLELEILDIAATGTEPLSVDGAADGHGFASGISDHVDCSGQLLGAAELEMFIDRRGTALLGAGLAEFHFIVGVGDEFFLARLIIVVLHVQAARYLFRRHAMFPQMRFGRIRHAGLHGGLEFGALVGRQLRQHVLRERRGTADLRLARDLPQTGFDVELDGLRGRR